jgi:transcriptional regulator with XRE-family HTH domain
LHVAVSGLERITNEETEGTRDMLAKARRHCKLKGLRRFARRTGVDPANLARVLKGGRKPSPLMLAKLRAILTEKS